MTTAERLAGLFKRVPVETNGLRNFEVLALIADQTERIAKRTTSGPAGITFTFRDDSSLTYNAETQQATTTRPTPTPSDIFAARNYIMQAIANRAATA